MKTTILLTAALALASLAYGKTYNIVLGTNTQVGTVQLKAGEYNLKVVNGQAVFTSADTSKSFTAPVTVKTANHKYDETAVDTANKNGSERIVTVELGGSSTQLEFGE